jgi:RNA polymerase sigma-70 factor, ECF subfamily
MADLARLTDLTTLSDEALVGLVRAGDRSAFAAVIQRHNQRLYRVARGIVRDDSEAEDIVQETYVKAFARLGAFRGEAKLSTWLTRIAVNEALDRLRSRKPEVDLRLVDGPGAKLDDAAFALTAAPASPEQSAARSEIRGLVESAVDALPETFRIVFVMRDIEEMSIDETAAHLGLKPETVKTRLHRARRLLRDRLEDTLAAALADSFPFGGKRCAGLTAAVLARLGLKPPA